MTNNSKILTIIEDRLKMVYDPEFPIVDIYTLWLIYNIDIEEDRKKINLLITFTTPMCPMADILKEMIINWIAEVLPDYEVVLEVTFEPLWTIEKIKDPDLKRMFE